MRFLVFSGRLQAKALLIPGIPLRSSFECENLWRRRKTFPLSVTCFFGTIAIANTNQLLETFRLFGNYEKRSEVHRVPHLREVQQNVDTLSI